MFTKKGFTLVEVLVVVLIIGILAGFAGREYRRSVHRAEAAEASMLIAAIRDAMTDYGTEFGHCPTNAGEWGIPVVPEALEFYNYTESDPSGQGMCDIRITPKSTTGLDVSITVRAKGDSGLPDNLLCSGKDCDVFGVFGCKETNGLFVYARCDNFI